MLRFLLCLILALAASPALAQAPDFAATGSNDPSLVYMQQIFGSGLFEGGSGPSTTVLAEYARLMNSVVLAVGAVFMTWQIVAGTMQSAHEGEVLGRQWSSLWAPLRMAVAGAGMIPLPSGYCAVQMLTASLITTGVGAGSWIYGQTIDRVMTGTPISARVTPDYSGLAPDVWDMLVCQHAINTETNIAYGAPALGIPRPVRSGNNVVYASPVQSTLSGVDELSCGSIALDIAAHVPALAQAHQAGLNALISGLDPIAQRVAVAAYIGSADHSFPSAGEIAKAVQGAERVLSDGIVAAMAAATPKETSATLAEMKAGGWLWAGTWYNKLARQNERFAEEAGRLPEYTRSPERLVSGISQIQFAKVQKASKQLISAYSNPASAGFRPNIASLNNGKETEESGIFAKIGSKITGFANDLNSAISQYLTPSKGNGSGIANLIKSGADSPVHRLVVFGVVVFNLSVTAAMLISVASMTADTKVLGFGLSIGTFFAGPGGAVLNTAVLGLVACGAFLGYILPLLPYAIWTTSVVAYFVLAAEAIIAGPLWAFAHLRMGGEGLHGHAGSGYMISFNLLMRPTLMIGGLFAGMAIAAVGVGMVTDTFVAAVLDDVASNTNAATVGATVITGGATLLLSTAIRLGFFTVLTVVICERSFALIHKLPDAVTRWVGGQGEHLEEGHTGDQIRAAAMVTKQNVVNAAGQGRDTTRQNQGNGGKDSEGADSRSFRGAAGALGVLPSSGSAPAGASTSVEEGEE